MNVQIIANPIFQNKIQNTAMIKMYITTFITKISKYSLERKYRM